MKENFFVKHWVAAFTIAVLTCLLGVVSLTSLSVEQYPDIAPPMVTVQATYSGADANTVMESVVMPLEEVINGVQDMMYMDASASSNGEGEIDIYFKQGVDADEAMVNVQNRVSKASGVLPEAVIRDGVTIEKNVNATLLIMSLESTDGKFDQSFISNYLDINVMPSISRIPGVGRTSIMGELYGVRIWLKPDLMGIYGVTPEEVIACINEQNFVAPVGRLESTNDKIDIEFNGLLDDIGQFENIIIRASEKGEVLRLHDLADVELGARAYDFRTNISGNPGVMFYVKQAPGANATQVNANIREVLDEISGRLPAGLEFKLLETSDDFLYASMYNVVETLIIAIILVVLVVYFFLQDVRATIIPSISIIVSLIGTFAIVKLAGFSLNLLTLFALVLAIGTVVDDAIVVVEAVITKLEKVPLLSSDGGKDHPIPSGTGRERTKQAISEALGEVTAACISTTLVFMAVFIPVTFMSGTAGTFFKQFGITMASAVGLSAVSALTLCPILCLLMLKPANNEATEGTRKTFSHYVRMVYETSYNALLGKYMKAVQRFIHHSRMAWAILLLACVALFLLISYSKDELVPQEDQGFLLVNVALKPGTFLNRTEATTVQLEEYILTLDEVEEVGALTGYSMMKDVTSPNYATLMVRLKNWKERPFYSIFDVQKSIAEWARVNLPQADIEAFQMPQIPGYGNGSDIDVNIQDRSRSADKKTFVAMNEEFVRMLNERPEIDFATSSYSTNYPKYKLDVDEIACKRMGVSPASVVNTIGTFLAGSYIGSYVQYSNIYRVMVQAGKEYRMSEHVLNNIFVPVQGKMVPASEFVTLTPSMGSAMEHHFNLFPSYPVSAMPAEGYTAANVYKAIHEVADEVFPENVGYEFAGMAREEVDNANSNESLLIYSICLLIIYLIMACLYDSLLIPFAVMLSIPFGLLGAYLAVKPLELMGVGANIYVQTGLIMIIGLIAKTAILITEFAVQKYREGMSITEAALGACRDRLRPIMMTVFSMIMGMVPLALGNGAGAVGNKSLALTVIGGMIIGTIALLFITPAFYIIFQKISERLSPVNTVAKAAPVIVCVMLLSSCSLYKEYDNTKVQVPEQVMGDNVQSGDTTSIGAVPWREMFTDPLLQQLIERAIANNTDVKAAQLTIEQAQNDLASLRMGDLPTLSFQPTGSLSHFNHVSSRIYEVPVVANWQLNIFGQNTTLKRQKRAQMTMYEDYRQAVISSLAANVANTYYTLVMYDQKLQILEETKTVWEQSLESIRTLYEAGLYMSPAVYQMEASLASVQAGITEMQEQILTVEASLCLLLSEAPHHIERSTQVSFSMPRQLSVGVPLRLLSSRPDVRQAARNMEVAYYGIQQARQAFYPDIVISAGLGWSNGLEGMVNPGKMLVEAVASLTQPLFAQGKLRAKYKNAKLDQEKAQLQFTQTLLNAGNEVYRYLHTCYSSKEKEQYLHTMVTALHEAYLATNELMMHGTNTYLEVLKAQEDLLSTQLSEVENRYKGIQAFINLYTALGGYL